MNNHKLKFVFLLLVGMGLTLPACKDYLDVNVDPNQATSSRIDLQLSSAQLQTAIGIGQRIYPTAAIWSQYWTGGPGVSLGDPDQNKLSSSEGNEIFRNLYRSSNNLNYILKNSSNAYYLSVAKILQAYNFQTLVDLFGDIPYTDALKGDITDGSILHPRYDSAKDVIYPALEAQVLDAIRMIEAGTTDPAPATDDLMYKGNMEKWDKFAHTLLLKIYLRQGASGQAKAAALYGSDDQFIVENADNALVAFPGGSAGSNPLYNSAFSTALGNYYVATTTILDYLATTQDPRVDAFFDPNNAGVQFGLDPGDVQNAPSTASFSKPSNAIIFSPTAPVIFMSAWEGNLLLAEASARGWIGSDAAAEYEAGVRASFEYLGLEDSLATNYLAGSGGYDAGNAIRSIALQKWVSMNGLQPVEAWIETRRFDTPGMPIFTGPGGLFKSPTQNALGANLFPSILPYPESEESLNQSFPGQHPITAKVFWDN